MTRGRSVYVERRADGRPKEDVLSCVMFNIFMAFDDLRWADELLRSSNVTFSPPIQDVRFSWLFEECVNHTARGFVIADIVLCWRDSVGNGVLVFEAKTLRERASVKDFPEAFHYSRMPSFRRFERASYRLLLDDGPAAGCVAQGVNPDEIVTWNQLRSIQERLAAECIDESTIAAKAITEAVRIQHRYWLDGQSQGEALPNLLDMAGSFNEHSNRARFLIGFDTVQRFRLNMPIPKRSDWIGSELSQQEIRGKQYQITSERRIPHWLIS